MIVLGLDLSFTATGWVVLHARDQETDEKPEVRDRGRISTPSIPKAQAADVFLRSGRIMRIVDAVLAAVAEHKPNLIGIEDYSYESVEGAHLTGELHGVLLHYLWRTEQVVDRVPIGTWRRLALGNGQTAKDAVAAEVLKRYGEEFRTPRGAIDVDVTEAYGVAIAAWMRRIGADKPFSARRRPQRQLPLLTFDPFK